MSVRKNKAAKPRAHFWNYLTDWQSPIQTICRANELHTKLVNLVKKMRAHTHISKYQNEMKQSQEKSWTQIQFSKRPCTEAHTQWPQIVFGTQRIFLLMETAAKKPEKDAEIESRFTCCHGWFFCCCCCCRSCGLHIHVPQCFIILFVPQQQQQQQQ